MCLKRHGTPGSVVSVDLPATLTIGCSNSCAGDNILGEQWTLHTHEAWRFVILVYYAQRRKNAAGTDVDSRIQFKIYMRLLQNKFAAGAIGNKCVLNLDLAVKMNPIGKVVSDVRGWAKALRNYSEAESILTGWRCSGSSDSRETESITPDCRLPEKYRMAIHNTGL